MGQSATRQQDYASVHDDYIFFVEMTFVASAAYVLTTHYAVIPAFMNIGGPPASWQMALVFAATYFIILALYFMAVSYARSVLGYTPVAPISDTPPVVALPPEVPRSELEIGAVYQPPGPLASIRPNTRFIASDRRANDYSRRSALVHRIQRPLR